MLLSVLAQQSADAGRIVQVLPTVLQLLRIVKLYIFA